MKRIIIKGAKLYLIPNSVVQDISGDYVEVSGTIEENDELFKSDDISKGVLFKNGTFGDFVIPDLYMVNVINFLNKKSGDMIDFETEGKLLGSESAVEYEDCIVVFENAIIGDSKYGKFEEVLSYIMEGVYAA